MPHSWEDHLDQWFSAGVALCSQGTAGGTVATGVWCADAKMAAGHPQCTDRPCPTKNYPAQNTEMPPLRCSGFHL